jgi:hypothetical protein
MAKPKTDIERILTIPDPLKPDLAIVEAAAPPLVSGDYYDNNAGAFKRRGAGRTLQTAVQLAIAPTPPAAAAVVLPEVEIPLLQSDILARALCNGHDQQQAAHQVRQENKASQKRQRTISPDFAAATEELCGSGLKAYTEAATRVREQALRIGELENKLRARAELLSAIAADTGSLVSSRAELDDPVKALALSDERLLRLNNLVKHLPSRIADNQARAATLTPEILGLAKAGKISIPALVKDLYDNSGPEPGAHTCRDRPLRSLIDSGFFSCGP